MAQQRDASCNQATELALVVSVNSADQFYIEVWHLDDFLQGLPAEPIYGYTASYDPPGHQPSTCAWEVETNSNPACTYPLPSTGKYACLPPNTPYVVDIQHLQSSARTTFTYFLCTTVPPDLGDPNDPDDDEYPAYDPVAHGFYCPYEDDAPGQQHQDVDLTWDGTEIDIRPYILPGLPSGMGIINLIGGHFGGDEDHWVLPYDYDAVCADLAADADPTNDCASGEKGSDYFISPQVGYDYTFALVDLDLRAAWAWTWTDAAVHSVRLQPGKKFIVEGDLVAEGVTMTRVPGQAKWGGVLVAGSLDADGVTVEHATTGVKAYDPATVSLAASTLRHNTVGLDVLSTGGVTVSGSDVYQNGTGVRSGVPCSAAGCTCLTSCYSDFSIFDSFVRINTGAGVLAIDATAQIERTEITGNHATGLGVSRALVSPFLRNVIEDNGYVIDEHHGVTVLSGGDLYLSQTFPNDDERGENRLANNAYAELAVAPAGFVFAGNNAANGYNAIYDAGSSYYLIINNGPVAYEYDLEARYTYWGTTTAPPASSFLGPVNYANHLTCDPTDNACRLPGGEGLLASARDGGTPEGSNPGGEGLRAEIRATRAALAAGPGAEGAAGLVHRLWALHRQDRADVLGEYGRTAALLAALRQRLAAPPLPAPLRATAEAALWVEASDALSREAYEAARGLIAAWGGYVEGPVPARVLLAVEAHLAAVAGDYASAASLMAEVAAREEDAGLRREIEGVAAVYAERAEEAGAVGGFASARGVTAATSGLGRLRRRPRLRSQCTRTRPRARRRSRSR